MDEFPIGIVILFLFSRSIALEELQYTTLGQLSFGCPKGWQAYETNCYKLVDVPMDFKDAELTCLNMGAMSVQIDDDVENMKIAEFGKEAPRTKFWNGLKYKDSTKCDGIWDNNQPPEGTADDTCVSVNENGLWQVTNCKELLPFICEKPACINGTSDCGNGKCINTKWFCDRINDCPNGLDEMDCANHCSFYKSGKSGTITQGSYKANADCLWTIEGPVGTQLKLMFTKITTEKDRDVIEVWGGSKSLKTSTLLTTLSGSLTNRIVYSISNFLVIRFRSDASVESTGFVAKWVSDVPELSRTVKKIVASDAWQSLSSPFYPNSPPYSFFRHWLVTTDAGSIITLEIVNVDLQSDWELLIYDSDSYMDEPVKIRSSSDIQSPPIYMSSSNNLRVILRGMKIISGKGISMRVKKGCNVEIRQSAGEIYSPGFYTKKYPTSISCSWTLYAPDTDKRPILLKLVKFALAADKKDVVKVYNGPNAKAPALHDGDGFMGVLSDTKSVTGGDTVHVTFTSSLIQDQGLFKIEFSIGCPAVPQSANMTLSSDSKTYGSKVTVTCDTGYSFTQEEFYLKSSVLLSCLKGGKWNITRYPTCQMIYCGVPAAIPNGFIATNESRSVTYGSKKIYKCYPGFKMQESPTVTCLDTGKWSTPPTCKTSVCSSAGAIADGVPNLVTGDGTAAGSIVNYTCNDGYELRGPLQILCQSNTSWSHAAPKCTKIMCPIPIIINGDFTTQEPVMFETTVTLTCNKGYLITNETSNTKKLQCLASGTLSEASCEDKNECKSGGNCQPSQQCINTVGSYRCVCKDGYSGTNCDDIDECAPNKGKGGCSGTCENAAPFYNCKCSNGYVLFTENGTMNRFIAAGETGLRQGDVYYINHTCVPVTCERPPNVSNVIIHSQRSIFYFDDIVKISCLLGWELIGSSSLTCTANGKWNTFQPTCKAISCPTLIKEGSDVQKARVKRIIPATELGFGEEVKVECSLEDGSLINKTLYCEYNSENKSYILQGDAPVCPVVDCGQPEKIPGMKTPNVADTTVNKSFTFECTAGAVKSGMSADGSLSTVTCQKNGRWNYGNLTCKATRCGDPGTPGGATQIVNSYEGGQSVSYNCTRPGYTPFPPEPRKCTINADGTATWDGNMPRCKDTTPPEFTNCPSSPIAIDSLDPPGFAVPTARDNSGMMLSISETTKNFDPLIPVKGATTITYTAIDGENNSAECVIKIQLKNREFPNISCPNRVKLTIDDAVSKEVNLTQFINSTSPLSNVPSVKVGFSTYGHTENIHVTATNDMNMTSSCAFQVQVTASKCFPQIQNPLVNAEVIHVSNADGTVNSTTVTCKSGYAFSDGNTTKTYVCKGENVWTPELPLDDCIEHKESIYTFKINVEYELNITGMNSAQPLTAACTPEHDNLVKQHIASENTLSNLCRKDLQHYYRFSVSSIKTSSGFYDIKSAVVLEVLNFDGDTAKMNTCANAFKTYYKDVLKYSKHTTCGPICVKGGTGLQEHGSSCKTGFQLVTVSGSSKCLPCQPGTYSSSGNCVPCADGKYQDAAGATSCKNCGDNQASLEPRFSKDRCIDRCNDGFNSASGLPPCTACPVDTYWKNSTFCEPCPSDGSTLNMEGLSNVKACHAACAPGSYSITGYEPCSKCPKNFYAVSPTAKKQKTCTECPTARFTDGDGKTNSAACKDTNLCTNCSGQGTCVMTNHKPYCTCKPGFTGENCNITINFCSSNPCENGAACKSESSGFTCTCPAATECVVNEEGNFWADTASLETVIVKDIKACKDKCFSKTDCKAAAFHNANKLCVIYSETQVGGKTANKAYTWLKKTCTYQYHFSGTYCERDLRNNCTNTSCSDINMCMDLIDGFQCVCPLTGGYSGERCEIDADLCKPNPCINGGECVSYEDVRFQCLCKPGYTGTTCETNINECEENPTGCLYGGQCVDGVNKYTCTCPSGFTGEHCQEEKIFCANSACANGICLNDYDVNKAICICEDPYQTDTKTGACTPVDYCGQDKCTTNHTTSCSNSLDGVTCRCKAGYDGSLCQHNADDCASDPCVHGTCTDGFQKYSCACDDGWEGKKCDVNTNDCVNQCTGDHVYNCTDLLHDYKCNCKPGYTGENCTKKIDECLSLPCKHGGNCTDGDADFSCSCPDGWQGKTCADPYNYCNDTTCDNKGQCYSLMDTFYCRCEAGTQGTRCETSPPVCKHIDPCTKNGNCDESGGTATCTCKPNYTGVSCQLIEDSCSKAPCKNEGSCVTESIGYSCTCMDGYQGTDCKKKIPLCVSGACGSGQSCVEEGMDKYCLCPAKQVSTGTSCKDGSLDFDMWFEKGVESDDVVSGQPFKLSTSGNLTLMVWIGLLTDTSNGTVFKIKNNMDSTTYLEVKTNNVIFKGNEVEMSVPTGKWNHIAITWQSNGEYELIINGIKKSGTATSPQFKDLLVRLVFDSQFTGYVSQLTVWRDILSYTEILRASSTSRYLPPSFDLALGWYDYSLTKSTWRLVPSQAKLDEKLCNVQRYMDSECANKIDKVAPSSNCSGTAVHTVSSSRTVQVRNVAPAIKFEGQQSLTNNLKGDLLTWGAYQLVYAATDEAGNIGDCRFKLYVKEQDCDSSVYTTSTQCGTSKSVQGFCSPNSKPAVPWPNIVNCGVLGSYNRLDPFEMPDEPTCGATDVQKFTVTVDIKYQMLILCNDAKVSLLNTAVKAAFSNLEKSWTSLTIGLSVSGSCSKSVKKEVLIKAEFSKLSSKIKGLPPIDIIKQAVLENNILEGKAFSDIANAMFQKSEALFDQYASCDSAAYVIVGNDCVQCGTGSFFNGTLKQCVLCPVGYYNPNPGKSDACVQCSQKKTTLRRGSKADSDCVAKCPVGQYLKNKQCKDCSKDFYQNEEGKDYCRPCPLGKITKNAKTDSIDKCFDDCPSGTELNEAGNCTDCQQGFYRTQTVQDVCTKCPEHKTTRNSKSVSEDDCNLPDCQKGSFINETNSKCFPCPMGQYQPLKWQFKCNTCNESYTTVFEGSKSESDCKFYCPAGSEVESEKKEKCRQCPRGTYRQNVGNETFSSCQNCTQNTTDGSGSKTKDECSIPICMAGQRITNNECEDCPVDTYQNVSLPDSKTVCVNCSDGFGTKTKKSTSKDSCKAVCPAGQQYNAANGSCVLCPQGYWKKDSLRFDKCEQCPENYTTVGQGSTDSTNCSIRNCPAGTKIHGKDCVPCPFGKYQDEPRQTSCKECGPNLNTSSTGSSSVKDCTISCGVGLEGPKGKCVPCKDDFVKSYSGNGKCEQCTVNRTSNSNHTSCTGVVFCEVGVEYITAKKECSPCAVGYYKNNRGNTNCEACPGNYTTADVGTEEKKDCDKLHCVPGFYGNSGFCKPCDLGSYKSTSGIENCTKCKDNFTTNSIASTNDSDCSIVVCNAGSFRNQKNKCELCPKGQYQPKPGMESCESCPKGNYTTENLGSTQKKQCLIVCSEGKYRNDKNECSFCQLGFYQPKAGQAECMNCSTEHPYITANTGSTSVDQCLKVCDTGSYRPVNNRVTCIKCEIGKYQPDSGKTSCIPCGKATDVTTLQTGSSSKESCMPICPAGKYLDAQKRDCRLCELGKYNDKTGTQQQCKSCPDKKTTPSMGANSIDLCSLDDCGTGYYKKPGETGCSECERDTYQDQTSQSSCKPCPDNKVTLLTGAKSVDRCVLDCPTGQEYNGIFDNGKCTKCRIGEYRPKEKSDKCLVCPKGQTTIQLGATKCVVSKEPPKPIQRVSVRVVLKFQLKFCGNPTHMKGVLNDFIVKITVKICSSWNEKCKKLTVKFKGTTGCPISKRRKRANSEVEATVEISDLPEILSAGTTRRTAEGVFADGFGVDAQPDTVELEDNGIAFDGLRDVSSAKTCATGSVLVNNNCVPCKAGTKFVNVTTACVSCTEEGKYQDKPGQSECLPCPGMKVPSPNATSCLSKCEADPKYCQNGGRCIEKSDSEVVCACVSPYIGTVCDIRSDPSQDSQLKYILGASIGGGGGLLLLLLICIGLVAMKRRKDKKKYLKSAQSQASEPPPFMGMMEPVPYLAHKSHHLNPLYNNNEAMDFYDPVGTSMFDRPYNAMSREEYQFTEAPQSSVYRPIVGSSSSQRRGTYHE